MKLDPQVIRQAIANLILEYPELEHDDVLRADMIEAETPAFDFLDEVVRRIEDTEAHLDGVIGRVKVFKERAERFERRIEALRALAFKVMNTADLKKVELPTATLSIRNGAPQVVVHDEASLPADCIKTVTVPDKTAIREKLKAGDAVPGAYLSNGGPTLSIRVK